MANNRYLTAIRDGMAVIIPVSIIGSFFTILLNLPIDAWKAFIQPSGDVFFSKRNLGREKNNLVVFFLQIIFNSINTRFINFPSNPVTLGFLAQSLR